MRNRSSYRKLRISVTCLSILAATGCVMGGQMTPPSGASSQIERDEIDKSSATNAYDLVYQVRPAWLRGRGAPNLRGGSTIYYKIDKKQILKKNDLPPPPINT